MVPPFFAKKKSQRKSQKVAKIFGQKIQGDSLQIFFLKKKLCKKKAKKSRICQKWLYPTRSRYSYLAADDLFFRTTKNRALLRINLCISQNNIRSTSKNYQSHPPPDLCTQSILKSLFVCLFVCLLNLNQSQRLAGPDT